MKTITSYKVVYINSFGDLEEKDFSDLQGAQDFAQTVSNPKVYKVQLLGSMIEVV